MKSPNLNIVILASGTWHEGCLNDESRKKISSSLSRIIGEIDGASHDVVSILTGHETGMFVTSSMITAHFDRVPMITSFDSFDRPRSREDDIAEIALQILGDEYSVRFAILIPEFVRSVTVAIVNAIDGWDFDDETFVDGFRPGDAVLIRPHEHSVTPICG